MKKLLFFLALLPFLAHSQAVIQQSKTPSTGATQGNQYFQWYGGAFSGYVIFPIGTNAVINRQTGVEGQVYLQTSDTTLQVFHNGHFIPFGGGGSGAATYFSSTYFGGLGTPTSPITINPIFELLSNKTATASSSTTTYPNWLGVENYVGTHALNIYNSDGTLTGNRIVTVGTDTLQIIGNNPPNSSQYFQDGNSIRFMASQEVNQIEAGILLNPSNYINTYYNGESAIGDTIQMTASGISIHSTTAFTGNPTGFDISTGVPGIEVSDGYSNLGLFYNSHIDSSTFAGKVIPDAEWIKARIASYPHGGGTVTSVTSANANATVANTTTTPVITIVAAPKWTTARNLAGNSVDGSANVAFTNKFIAQGTTDAGLSGAQFLGSLSTGIVKNTTTTGVLSIATAGTDYQVPISLTTTGTSGAATFSGGTLNIPNYANTTYSAGTGLTLTGTTFSVNTSQSISTLSNLTSNGLVQTTGGTGALSVVTTTLPSSITGSSLTSVGTLSAGSIPYSLLTGTPATGTSSVSNSDASLTISPTTGAVVASLNTAHANNWTALQTFNQNTSSVAALFSTTSIQQIGANASDINFESRTWGGHFVDKTTVAAGTITSPTAVGANVETKAWTWSTYDGTGYNVGGQGGMQGFTYNAQTSTDHSGYLLWKTVKRLTTLEVPNLELGDNGTLYAANNMTLGDSTLSHNNYFGYGADTHVLTFDNTNNNTDGANVFEMVSPANNNGSTNNAGAFVWYSKYNTTNHRVAQFAVTLVGSTANNYGGAATVSTKPNNSASMVAAQTWNNDQTITLPHYTTAGILHNTVTTGAITSSPVSLTADISGILPIANGGTGIATAPALGSMPYGSTSTALAYVAPNTTTTQKFLTETGTGTVGAIPVMFDLFGTANTWLATNNTQTLLPLTNNTYNLGSGTFLYANAYLSNINTSYVNNFNNGNETLDGTSSGIITLQTQANSGTYNWNWPTTAGTAGQVLTSQAGGSTAITWTTPGTFPQTSQSTTYAILTTDFYVDCTGTITVTLPTAVGVSGKTYVITDTGIGVITVATTGGQTISGSATQTVAAGNSITLHGNGANWFLN